MTHLTPPMPPSRPWWLPLVISSALGAFSILYTEYRTNDRADIQRLVAVEQKVEARKESDDEFRLRLNRIESKVDQILLYLGGKTAPQR